MTAKAQFLTRFTVMNIRNGFDILKRLNNKITLFVRFMTYSVGNLARWPANAVRMDILSGGTDPHLFTAHKEMLQLFEPEDISEAMLVMDRDKWFLKSPETHMMAGPGAAAIIGGDFKADIMRTIKQVKVTNGGGRIVSIENNRDRFTK